VSQQKHEHLEQELKDLYAEVPAPPADLVAGRQRLLAEAAQLKTRFAPGPLSSTETNVNTKPTGRRKMNLMLAYKVLAVVMAMVMAVAGMGGSVVLAADSLPGDLLYPVKLISEDVSLALTPDPSDRARLSLDYAAERVSEMERLSRQGEDVPDSVLDRMARQMSQAMVEIARSRPEEVPALLQRVTERARTYQETLEQTQSTVRQETQTQLHEAAQLMERACQEAETALNDPARFRDEYQLQQQQSQGSPQGAGASPSGEPERSQEESQYRYEGTAGPHGEASVTPVADPQQLQQEQQQRSEGSPGPHGQATPTPTETPVPSVSPQPSQTMTPAQEQEQQRDEGDPGPQDEQQGPSTKMPQATTAPKGGDHSGHSR
jgi:hypothetical protein